VAGDARQTFRLTHFELCSQVIDGEHAEVHWRVDIHSRITGVIVPTELVDLIEVRDARIGTYTCRASSERTAQLAEL
jgi:hypothetical protein